MSYINIKNLTFSYDGGSPIFDNVSLEFDSSWKIGLVGRNGIGKSTLVKILSRKLSYKGQVITKVEFTYFPYKINSEDYYVIDVIKSIIPSYQLWQVVREFNLLNLNKDILYREFASLSSGEKSKVLLAGMFLKPNTFLLIDEPTNHLDIKAREVVRNYLNSKSGFIVISHDRAFLDKLVDHIISINRKDIKIQKGNFSSYLANKENEDNYEVKENERLLKEIARLNKAANQRKNWADKVEKTKYNTRISGLRPDTGYLGHKSEKLMKQFKNTQKRQERIQEDKSKLLKNIDKKEDLTLKSKASPFNNLITIKDLSLYYDDNQIIDNFNLEINKLDRVALVGENGSGKSSILKYILGKDIKHRGEAHMPKGIKISYVNQEVDFLKGNLSNICANNQVEETLFKTILRKLNFERELFNEDSKNYSDGQKKKVILALSLCQEANLYIWDEPLNYIDVISRIQIEEVILKSKPTMLFVEHDESFVKNIATKIIKI